MVAELGNNLRVKIDVSSTMTVIGGARSDGMALTHTPVDIGDKSSAWAQRAGGGIEGVFQCSGVLPSDDAALDELRQHAINRTSDTYHLENGEGDFWAGTFFVTSFRETGERNGETTYEFEIASHGEITWTEAS